ncbi:anthocyanidin 3-O-glucosyltransferase 7-like [Vigna unguiculata]|uniref:anthocyanidin 3-O-glucosyltransferase 7-like n=1 Tax=Vigna unguiculata TaxID=3917 RepID=UPI001015CB7A|nr:anthocyanidin 3-O-glucosyltransferase 7-like [Vigna unguiculata]
MENKHIAVIAFPFGSHLKPLLNLVLKLAQAAPHSSFSFIGTHKSNAILFPGSHIPNNIKPYTISDGIPEGHVLSNNPTEKIDLFLKTGPHNLHKGIQLAEADTEKRVTCIIADAFVTSSLLVAQTLDVPWIALWLPNSCSLSLYFYTDLIRHHCANHAAKTTLDFLPGLSKIRVEDIPQDLVVVGEKESVFTRTLVSLGKVLPQAKAVVMNCFEELDPPLFVQDMRSKLQSLLYVVPFPSPLLPLSDKDSSGCLSWLDTKSARSVVYVCFGTVVAPPPDELVAVAEALVESGFPFLWSLKEALMGGLPSGFVERTKMRGKVVPLAPQTQVLAHDSIGVFLTHCGANSVMECVSSGVPMICRPFFGDQDIAGRVIEDIWESGMIIEGRVFTKNALVKSLNLILVQEEGKKIRENALKAKKIVEDAVRPEGQAAKDFKTLVEIISTS